MADLVHQLEHLNLSNEWRHDNFTHVLAPLLLVKENQRIREGDVEGVVAVAAAASPFGAAVVAAPLPGLESIHQVDVAA